MQSNSFSSVHQVNSGWMSYLRNILLQTFIGIPPPEEKDPAFATVKFIRNFEEAFGRLHPPFFEGSYSSALRQARNEFKFLIVYLHSSVHSQTHHFCVETLANEPLIEIINDNFIIWGGDVEHSEACRVSWMLGATTYPFLAIISNVDGSIELIDRMEGVQRPEALMERLASILENQGPILVAARTTNEERERDRLLREEQDLAYLESLREDQEKERRMRDEEKRKQEEEELRIAEENRKKQEKEEQADRIQKDLEKKTRALPPEPNPGEKETATFKINLPDGQRFTRRFYLTDTIQDVYNFVDVSNKAESVEPGKYDLVTNFPRQSFTDKNISIGASGLSPQTILFVEMH